MSPSINADQAHRIVRIFAEHMRETTKKVNDKLEQNRKRLGTLGLSWVQGTSCVIRSGAFSAIRRASLVRMSMMVPVMMVPVSMIGVPAVGKIITASSGSRSAIWLAEGVAGRRSVWAIVALALCECGRRKGHKQRQG